MEAAYVIGLGLYAGLMGAFAPLLVRRLAARQIPELALAPSDSARQKALGSIWTSVDDDDHEYPFYARVPTLIVLGLLAWLGARQEVTFPVACLFVMVMLTTIPALAAIRFWLIRDRLRIRVRRQLLEMGVAVCQTCGASLTDDIASQCPACGDWPGEEVIPAKPVAAPVPETTDSTGPHPKWTWIASLLVLLILMISVPFEMSFLKSTGKTWRESYRRVEVPGELTINVEKPDWYGVFVPESAVTEEAALIIQVVDSKTGQELTLRKRPWSKTHVTADKKEVKVVRTVRIPAAGEYQVITAGLESGAVYIKPAMRGWAITRVLIVGSPLACVLLLISVTYLAERRREAAEFNSPKCS